MNSFKKCISILKEKKVTLDKGITFDEIKTIEKIYEIEFPKELKSFFSVVLPISHGFYNWRDFSDKNIYFIKRHISIPIENVVKLIEETDWNEDWGIEPDNTKERTETLRLKVETAPTMIPFCGHRYIPEINCEKCPVVSIHGIDVVYYGYGIEEYLSVEYGGKAQSTVNFEEISYIDFWSELV